MATAATPYALPRDGYGHCATGWWGMMLLIATEAMLFAYLLLAYFYIGAQSSAWPPHRMPELRLALPNTIILLLSSGTMLWAERGIRRGRRGRLVLGMIATIVLGAVFLAIQVVEYRHKAFTPQTDGYGSLFYTITGFHGAHVFVGLLVLVIVLVRALMGHFGEGRHLAVSNAAAYWHFVDVVWLFVFTSLYLTPRFLM